jgi:predicted nucleic acid-binding protein
MLIVDASVVAKAFLNEPGSELAYRVFATTEPLAAPAHMLAEVFHTLSRHERNGLVVKAQVDLAGTLLPAMCQLFPLQDLLAGALRICRSVPISFYDALYISLAEQRETVLVTADEKLIRQLSDTQWQKNIASFSDMGQAVPS